MESIKYLINGNYYEKDEILKDNNLKNELEKQLKKIKHSENCKLKRREYVKKYPDKIKQYVENNKEKIMEYQKKYR